jgi:lipopolysaccharide transport system ATP-binding protein
MGRGTSFHALKDISFEVSAGERVGIIGRNGSGKSTLLQIISGTLKQTSGEICVRGKIAALLELGSGFNPEYTGRENVVVNGLLLGLSEKQLNDKMEDILAFAEIGNFVDQPVKSYSSGMLMRLAFAVQTALEPAILIVDEALAVGDAPFQAKCFTRMRDLAAKGVTILLVSHDIATVRTFCTRALCLNKGEVYAFGEVKGVCDAYEILCMRDNGQIAVRTSQSISKAEAVSRSDLDISWRLNSADFQKRAVAHREGTGRVRLSNCMVFRSDGICSEAFTFNEKVRIVWIVRAEADFSGEIVVGLTIKTVRGDMVLSGTDKQSDHHLDLVKGEYAAIYMDYHFPLKGGKYYFTTSIFGFDRDLKYKDGVIDFSSSELLDLVEHSHFIDIAYDGRWAHYGPVQIDALQKLVYIEASLDHNALSR